MATRKVRRFADGGEGASGDYGGGGGDFGAAGSYADPSTVSGYSYADPSTVVGEGGRSTRGVSRGPGTEAFALANPTEADYAAQDRSYMDANAANAALTTQENNMRDAQNLAASSQFVRDRDAQYAAQDNATNPGGSFGNAGIGYNTVSEGADGRAKGGMIKKYAKGGTVSSASSRGDGIAQRGKTRGRIC